ncbi:hypothetical protein OK351_02140 [Glutamicibacter sp. MNS18]|uniref:hypothetical protein n=1 Tax=Glutamicibacter sp. MNS18 TaxID=2989817 RepID=UPI002235C013|nr:hypothetical protein [Glutamicibacter sp. MNS18]MCW4464311.1 hypothetical protein [Glutamicibacter sp. MNS18]
MDVDPATPPGKPVRLYPALATCLALGLGVYGHVSALVGGRVWMASLWCVAAGLVLAFQSGLRRPGLLVAAGFLFLVCAALAASFGLPNLVAWSVVPLVALVLPDLARFRSRRRPRESSAPVQ